MPHVWQTYWMHSHILTGQDPLSLCPPGVTRKKMAAQTTGGEKLLAPRIPRDHFFRAVSTDEAKRRQLDIKAPKTTTLRHHKGLQTMRQVVSEQSVLRAKFVSLRLAIRIQTGLS